MILLLPASLLLFSAALITVLGIIRERFSSAWLIAVGGALASWVSLWVISFQMPIAFGVQEGNYANLPLPALSLQADSDTFPIALAISTLCLAVLFTDVSNVPITNWLIWVGNLGLAALGIIAVFASNPTTLVLAWTLLDAIELGILLRQVREEEYRQRVIIFFSTNVLGTLMILAGMIAANAAGTELSFQNIPVESQLYLLLAVGLRMGVFPLQAAFIRDARSQRGQATLLRLTPAAAGLGLLVHTARIEASVALRGVLLASAALAAVYGAIVWARVDTELRGRVFWIISVAGMAFAAAVQSQPAATLSWGLVLIYSGALLFLASAREKYFLPMGIVGALILTGLPFTPTYAGMLMYQPFQFFLIMFPIAHVLLLVGYVRHMLRKTEPISGAERWIYVIYPVGLALLPLTHILSAILMPNIPLVGRLSVLGLGGMAVVGAVLGLAYWRKVHIPKNVYLRLDQFFSLRWVFILVEWFGNAFGQLLAIISILLEGEGGVLWALVFLIMLVSILAQVTSAVGV